MEILLLFLFGIWLAARFSPSPTPPAPTAPQWRCTLRNKTSVVVTANSESDAMRELMKQRVDITRIATLERV